jgi:hypothetical protein
MQIAAMNPQYISRDDITQDEIAKMREITVDASLNDPASLPKPILNALIEKAITEKVWSDEDIAIYEEKKSNMNFLFNFLSEAAKTAGAQEYQRRESESVMEDNQTTEEVIAQAEAAGSTVFGRQIFTSSNLTFAPSMNLPTPVNYILGPGDEVIIDIWGTNQATIRSTISQDGTISVPDLGLISLNGMSIKQAESYMKRKLGQIYSVDGDNA